MYCQQDTYVSNTTQVQAMVEYRRMDHWVTNGSSSYFNHHRNRKRFRCYANTATISAAEAFNRTNNGAKHRTRSQANVG
jgi:hypothetical protein